ncbi:restriction endonuclease subunit S [Lactobacillaceae bacterium Melli_B3]
MDLTKSPAQLKASLLQDAMMGKLTQQLPEDGDAKDLLTEIDAEKDALIKAKKIKNQKALPEIEDDEIPFEIPDNWQWVRLGDICNKITDGTHNPPKNSHEGIPIISAKNITNNGVNFSLSNRYVTLEQFIKEDKRTQIRKDDILLSIVGSIGKVCIVKENKKFTAQRSICIIKTFIYNNFLSSYLTSPNAFSYYNDKSKGTAQKGVYLNSIRNMPIPLPPLPEQKKIVQKLDSLLPKIDEFNNSVEQLHNLREELPSRLRRSFLQSAMMGKLTKQLPEDGDASELLDQINAEKEALIKAKKIKAQKTLPEIDADEIPFEIPDNWRWVRLGDIAIANSGHNLNKYISKDGKVLYSKVSDMNLPGNEKYIMETYNLINTDRYVVPKNSIIFPKIGGAIKTNKRRLISNENTSIDPNTMAITPIINGIVDYLWTYMNNIDLSKMQAGTSMPSINKTKINNLIVPLPPLSEQKRIVNKLDKLFEELKG